MDMATWLERGRFLGTLSPSAREADIMQYEAARLEAAYEVGDAQSGLGPSMVRAWFEAAECRYLEAAKEHGLPDTSIHVAYCAAQTLVNRKAVGLTNGQYALAEIGLRLVDVQSKLRCPGTVEHWTRNGAGNGTIACNDVGAAVVGLSRMAQSPAWYRRLRRSGGGRWR